MPAVFEQRYVKKLDGAERQEGQDEDGPRRAADARTSSDFKKDNGCDRLVMVWCGSTEVYRKPGDVHSTLAAFEKGLESNDPRSRRRRSTPTPR